MKQTIWKYQLEVKDEIFLTMPADAKLLHVGFQNGEPVLWALLNPENEYVERKIMVTGTGWDISDKDMGVYIGSIQTPSILGELVWHYFDGGEV